MVASPWKDEFVLTGYDLAREGLAESHIAKALGVSKPTLIEWKRKKPLFRRALARGKNFSKGTKGTITFADYVYRRLPAELQDVWDRINRLSKCKTARERIDAIMANQGKQARQHLFIHAWIQHNFSISRAMRTCGLSRALFELWKRDPEFLKLVNEIEFHKKNFFEDQLIGLVRNGDTSATIFVNKTYNRDRGYGEKVQVEHTGTIQHSHALVSLEDLDLPLETRKEILAAIRKRKQVESNVIEAGEAVV